ncbi:MAG: Methyltransferase domain [Proteobacteria bacterium]|nr:Methyltransferase domain [Pseudomonadota bacterium]
MPVDQQASKPMALTTGVLADRSLPNLRPLLEKLPPQSLVADFGAGRGRHSLYAARLGHSVLAVEKRADTFADLRLNLERAGVPGDRMRLVGGDYLDVDPLPTEKIDLLVVTGVLQHCVDRNDLTRRLTHLADVTPKAGAIIFIEMLFDMKFDGKPKPGRVEISVEEFEHLLPQVFPAKSWKIERVAGPVSQVLDFSGGGRSFISEAKLVEQTAAEYVLTRTTSMKQEP